MSNVLRLTPEQLAAHQARRQGWTTQFSPPIVGEANANANATDRPKRKPGRAIPGPSPSVAAAPERAILKACIRALALDSRVAWATRMNTGAYSTEGGRYVRFGFKGCSDIIGQMSDGRFLAVECKREGGRVTEDQLAFLGRVSRAGGVAFVARGVDDIRKGLG